MISKEEILRIAELSKIEIAEEDIERYQKDLSAILDFTGKLSALPGKETDTYMQMMGLESVLRNDGDDTSFGADNSLGDYAPRTKDGFILSPRILKKE